MPSPAADGEAAGSELSTACLSAAPLRDAFHAAADALPSPPPPPPLTAAWLRGARATFLAAWAHVAAMADEGALRDEYARWLMDPSRSIVRRALAALEADARAVAAVAAAAGGRAAHASRIHAIEGALRRVAARGAPACANILAATARARAHHPLVALPFRAQASSSPASATTWSACAARRCGC